MADKLKQMHWKKILLMGGILMVALVAGLCVQKPEGIKPTPLQPSEELKLSDFPEAFKSTLIVVGDNASDIEMQAANEIADYLENETGNKPLIKKHSEISDEDKRNYNLIVVGTPKTNPLLGEVYTLTDATKVTEEFPGEGKGVLEILRSPWEESKAMLLVEGSDEWGTVIGSITLTDNKELNEKMFVIKGYKLTLYTTIITPFHQDRFLTPLEIIVEKTDSEPILFMKQTKDGVVTFILPQGKYECYISPEESYEKRVNTEVLKIDLKDNMKMELKLRPWGIWR